ncbi:MAG TPA: DUF3352 domain-containing protein [Thermoleophilaceae bacterium]|nr:DUF3352 domain-containing protein [Thermoleophilaceae bacterium]
MRPAKLVALLLSMLVLAAGLAGCGGSDGEAGSALDAGLSYLSKDAPFAVAIDTDVEGDLYKALSAIIDKFPFGDQVKDSIKQQIERSQNGVSFDKDIKPMLGNPFVVGGVDARSLVSGGTGSQFVGAIRSKDKDKLEALVDKSKAKEDGEKSGAKIYTDGDGDAFAIKDDTLVVAGSRKLLENALEQSEGDDHLDEETFNEGLEGLPENALVRVYADIERLLASSSGGRQARKIKWVGALRTAGLTAGARKNSIDVDFNLRTDSGSLREQDLPIAPGEDSPGVVERPGEIGIGVRNASQIVRFAEAALQAVDPSSSGDFQAGKRQIEQALKVDVDRDVVAQLTGELSVNIALNGKFGVRAELKDPAAFERTLAKVADVLPDVAEGLTGDKVGLAKPKSGEDFYALAQPDGDSVVFGVVDDAFVLANDPARAGLLGSASPRDVPGAKGAVVLQADAEELANGLLKRLGPQMGLGGIFGGRLLTGPLGDLTGSIQSDTDGMRGKFRLEIE